MTIAELIEKLQKLEPDLQVFVNGYEGGITDLRGASEIFVKLNVNTEHYYGPHEEFDPEDSYQAKRFGEPDCKGLLFGRSSW
jgi:hypothetical protein